MFGIWEWLIIILVLGWIVVPWMNRKSKAAKKKVRPKREYRVEQSESEKSAREVPFTPEKD